MIKLWDWEKKPRTMLRYIKIGDIFCFKLDEHTYGFGRIMACVMFHIVEFFDYTSDQPVIQMEDIAGADRLLVTSMDVYRLFDRKTQGDWRIIGHHKDYVPEQAEDLWFGWGYPSNRKKSNVFEEAFPIGEEEWQTLTTLTGRGDQELRAAVTAKLREREGR